MNRPPYPTHHDVVVAYQKGWDDGFHKFPPTPPEPPEPKPYYDTIVEKQCSACSGTSYYWRFVNGEILCDLCDTNDK